MKKNLLALLLLTAAIHADAQIDLGLPSTTGKGGTATAMVTNFEAIGINPSNLGWDNNYRFSITVANVGLNMQSKAIDLATLKNALLNPNDSFTTAQKQEYANLFATPEGFNMTGNVNWLATSFYIPKVGGFALNVRDRAYAHVGLNQNAADIIFMGSNAPLFNDSTVFTQNLSTVFDGCDITYLHYREANIAYGRRLLGFGNTDEDGDPAIAVYGGFGFKLVWGLANVDGKIDNGFLRGHASITNSYNINYGTIQNFSSINTSSFFNSVGMGTGMDFGASIVIKKKIRFAISGTDFGKITWKDNVLVASDRLMVPLDSNNTGLPNWNMSQNSGFLFSSDGIINYGNGEDFKSNLPSRLRMGFGWSIGERIQLGADFVMPMNKSRYNLSQPYMALGAEIKLATILKVNLGVSGNGSLGWNLPVGVTLGPLGPLEFGLATGDALTYLSKSKDPNLSFAIGIVRINIDPSLRDAAGASMNPPTPGL